MGILKTLVSLAATAMVVQLAMAATHTVGGANGGWDTSTDVETWVASQKFSVGDNLLFQYTPNHDVLEVSKADYDSCQTSSPLKTYSGGNTLVPLASPGKRYFICGTLGHCSQGMKIEVNTLATSPSTPPSASPAPKPSPSQSPAKTPQLAAGSPSPTQSPETSPSATPSVSVSPSPAKTPESAPATVSVSPSPADVSSSGSSETASSPSGPPPPSPANRNRFTFGFGLLLLLLLAL